MSNHIKFSDLFDFSDTNVVQKAIEEITALEKAYLGFVSNVTNSQLSTLKKQQDELVESVRELLQVTKELGVSNKEHQKVLVDNAAAIEKQSKAIEANKNAQEDSKKVSDILGGSVDALTARLKAQLAEFNKLDPSIDGNADRLLQLGKATQQTRTAIQQLTNETKVATTVFTAAKGSYIELDNETKQLKKDLISLADGFNPANKEALQLRATIAANTERLKAFDAAIGVNNRNVGNYASAFSGLNNATSQVFRELPSLAISMNTFFLAISNNLPILFDEIARTRKSIQELKNEQIAAAAVQATLAKEQAIATGATAAQAEAIGLLAREQALANAAQSASPSIWKALGSAVFSFQTVLTLAVLALTLFGGKLIDFFTGSSEASKKAAEENKKYSESLAQITKESQLSATTEAARLSILVDTARNTKLAQQERNAAVDELQSKYPAYFANLTKEAILNGDVAAAVRDARNAIFEKAAGEAALKKFNEAASKSYDLTLKQEEAQQKLNAATSNYKALNSAADANPTNGFARNAAIRALKDVQASKIAFDEATKAVKAADSEQMKYYNDAVVAGQKVAAVNEKLLGIGRTPARIKKDLEAVNKELEVTAKNTERSTELLAKQLALQDELAEAQGKKTPSQKADDKAERDFQALLKKRVELIKKNAAIEVQENELAYQKSARSTADQIQLEENKREVIVAASNDIMAITVQGTALYEDAARQKIQAEKDFAEHVRQISEKRREEEIQVMDDLAAKRKKEYDSRLQLEKEINGAEVDAKFASIDKKRAEGKISAFTQESQLHELRLQILDNEILQQQRVVNSAIEGSKEELDAKTELEKKKRDLARESADYEISLQQRITDSKNAAIRAALDFSISAVNLLVETQNIAYDEQMSALRTKYEADIELAGENKDAKKKIEKKYNEEVKKMQREQSENQKIAAIFSATINTYEAAARALKDYQYPYSLIVSALAIASGFAQVASISSQRVPGYWKGRQNGPAELAEVNERGWELIQRKNKYLIAGGGKRAITQLEAGDKVLTHEQSVKKAQEQYLQSADSEAFLSSLLEGTQVSRAFEDRMSSKLVQAVAASHLSPQVLAIAFKDAIADLPLEVNNWNDSGYKRSIRRGNSLVHEIHERNKMGGNG